MYAAVYAERRREKLAPLLEAATQMEALAAGLTYSADRSAIANAAAQLRTAADRLGHLGDHLLPYSQREFYQDMTPSRAKEDGGQFASSGLEYAFSE